MIYSDHHHPVPLVEERKFSLSDWSSFRRAMVRRRHLRWSGHDERDNRFVYGSQLRCGVLQLLSPDDRPMAQGALARLTHKNLRFLVGYRAYFVQD
jgi:hypothetical protein